MDELPKPARVDWATQRKLDARKYRSRFLRKCFNCALALALAAGAGYVAIYMFGRGVWLGWISGLFAAALAIGLVFVAWERAGKCEDTF